MIYNNISKKKNYFFFLSLILLFVKELEEGNGGSAKAKAEVLLQALRGCLRAPPPRRSLRRVRFLLAVADDFLVIDVDVTIEGF